jgi:integrase
MNDVVLNTKKIKRFLPNDEGHYNQDRPYSTDEIVKILDKCDIRSRVIILLMTSTGMRIGALPCLRLSDIKKMNEFGLYLADRMQSQRLFGRNRESKKHVSNH